VEELTKEVTDYFARAVSPKLPSGEDRPPEARRASIADLLYDIDPTPEGRARTQAVVGLAQYVAAANRQVGNLREMSERLRTILVAEQAAFIPEYQAELPELAQLAEKLKTYEARLAAQQDVVRRETAVRNARQSEAQDLQQKIQATSQTVAAETAALESLQRRLFELQQTFAQLQAANLQTESEIRAKETGR
jgi:chromosome segregation ATPase